MTRRVGTALLLACVFSARPSYAKAPEFVRVHVSSTCPAVSDVLEELAPLLPSSRVVAATSAAASEVSVFDDGESVRILVADEERSFRDPGRACRERARNAAVFIGLALEPPVLPTPEPEPEPEPEPQAPAPPRAPARAEAAPPLTLQLGPLLQVAPISDAAHPPVAGGFGARLGWGKPWGVALGAAFVLPTRLSLPAADARLVWLPFDVSLRRAHELGPVVLAAELGPELALLFASGGRVKNPRTSTRLELGARAGLSITWNMSRHLGAFATVFGVVRPNPYELKVNPGIASGSTPPVWVGASLGLSLRTD